MSPFGIEMHALRRSRGKLLGDVARQLNVSPSYLSQMEHGNRPVADGIADKIISIFELSGGEAKSLENAALASVNEFRIQLDRKSSNEDRHLAAAIVHGFARISKADKKRIADIIGRNSRG